MSLISSSDLEAEEHTSVRQKKTAAVTKQRKTKPVKIKLRRSLPSVFTENKNMSAASSKNPVSHPLAMNGKTDVIKSPLLTSKKKSSTAKAVTRRPSEFPTLPNEITEKIVDFSIPQEMIDECNKRRKELEDESITFLFEALKTLRYKDPLTFTEKFAPLNHLFEKSPLKKRRRRPAGVLKKTEGSANKEKSTCVAGPVVIESAEDNSSSSTSPQDTGTLCDAVQLSSHTNMSEKRRRGRPKSSYSPDKDNQIVTDSFDKLKDPVSCDSSALPDCDKLDEKRDSLNANIEHVNVSGGATGRLRPLRASRKRASIGFYKYGIFCCLSKYSLFCNVFFFFFSFFFFFWHSGIAW